MTYVVSDFTPVAGQANMWTDADGGLFIGRKDQTIESFVGELNAPPPPVSVDLTAYAANARWVKETAGITVAGVAVATDDRSKLLIAGARMAADADSNFTTLFAAADGSRTTLTAPQIIAISNAVLAHVAACFAKYDNVVSQIDAGTITTPAQIDAAFAAVQ